MAQVVRGATVVEVARQAGHAPTMALSTYAHLFDELDDGDHRPAADQIREAREGQKCPKVSVLCPPDAADPRPDVQKTPEYQGFRRADARNRTGDPFITSGSFAGQLP
jgi:hypothetical protein